MLRSDFSFTFFKKKINYIEMRTPKFNLSSLFILLLFYSLIIFFSELLLLVYIKYDIEVSYFFIVLSILLNIFVLLICFYSYKSSIKKQNNFVIPIIAIGLSVYYMFFQRYNLISIVDKDHALIELLRTGLLKISLYLNNIFIVLTYLFIVIYYSLNNKKK